MLVDTSVWIAVLRERTGKAAAKLRALLGPATPVLPRFAQLELLQGARDDAEWERLALYLGDQIYAEPQDTTWESAARIYFELRRQGITVRSPIDCCIAQLALEGSFELIHQDRDFERIATIRPLRQRYFDWQT